MAHHLIGMSLRSVSQCRIPAQRRKALLRTVFICRMQQLTGFFRLRMGAVGYSEQASEREDTGGCLPDHLQVAPASLRPELRQFTATTKV
jgi:hypothetical protein